jgi:hypothetical protein
LCCGWKGGSSNGRSYLIWRNHALSRQLSMLLPKEWSYFWVPHPMKKRDKIVTQVMRWSDR